MAAVVLPVWVSVVISVISLVVGVPLSALALFLSSKIFKQGISYGRAFLAALVVGIVGFVLGLVGPLSGSVTLTGVMAVVGFLVGLALYLVLPTLMLHLEWGKGVLTGLVWFGFMLVVGFVLGVILSVIAIALAAGAVASAAVM